MSLTAQKIVFCVVLTVLLWMATMVLQASASRGPDRHPGIQVPLIVLVLATPFIAARWRHRKAVAASLLAAQIGVWIAYETGISIDTNIRSDLMLIYPAILVTAWFAYRTPGGHAT